MRYHFSDCVLDTGAYVLTRGGAPVEVETTPSTWATAHTGQTVSRRLE